MDILTKPIDSFSFENIVAFAKEKNSEGIQLDYKEELPDKTKLAQLVAAFANTRGGVIIVGIKENRKTGEPTKWVGVDDGRHDEFMAQVIGNITPIPAFELHKTNEKNGKVFLLVRVNEGDETPYYAHNDSNIWIRTGSVKKSINIASPEHVELLFKKHESAQQARHFYRSRADFNYRTFLKNAEKERANEIQVEKENYRIAKSRSEDGDIMPPFKSKIIQESVGSNVAMLEMTLQPYYPHKQFIRPLDIEVMIQDSEERDFNFSFPSRAIRWDSVTEGMMQFAWNQLSGEINCQQIFANGLVYSSKDILRYSLERGSSVFLGQFVSQLYITLRGYRNLLTRFGYVGSLVGKMQIIGVEGCKIIPVFEGMFSDRKKSVFNHRSWNIDIDTKLLASDDELKKYVVETTRDIHWSFGYKDLQKGITVEKLEKKRIF